MFSLGDSNPHLRYLAQVVIFFMKVGQHCGNEEQMMLIWLSHKYLQHIVQCSHSIGSVKADGTPQSVTNVDLLYTLSSKGGISGILVILLL